MLGNNVFISAGGVLSIRFKTLSPRYWSFSSLVSDMENSWPANLPLEDAAYHAIGKITSSWAGVEFVYDEIIMKLIGNDQFADFIRGKLNNADRIEAIKILVNPFETTDPKGHFAILEFLKCAQICSENRSFVAHSRVQIRTPEEITFFKRHHTKRGKFIRVYATLNELREMADVSDKTQQFGLMAMNALLITGIKRNDQNFMDGFFMPITQISNPPRPRKWDTLRREEA